MPASCTRNESICSFCVRATSPPWASSTCCKLLSSVRVASVWRLNSSRSSRSKSRQGVVSLRLSVSHNTSNKFSATNASNINKGHSRLGLMTRLSLSLAQDRFAHMLASTRCGHAIDRRWRHAARERSDEVVGRQMGHRPARGHGRAGNVGR